MLQAISDRIKGWLGIFIVALIGLPFGLWGIQSYLDDGGPHYAAKVNGTKIPIRELENSVSQQRQKLFQQYKGKLPIKAAALRKQVLDQLINQRLLESVSYKEGYRISDAVMSAQIERLFSIGGKFNRAAMDAKLAEMGRSPQQFEYVLRNELRIQQMQAGVVNSSIASKQDVLQLAMLEQQLRDINVITFNVDEFAGKYQPTKQAIKKYYAANRQRFMSTEKVKVDYVELTTASIMQKITIDKDKVRSMYESYVTNTSKREQRKASHILILVGKSAKSKAAAKAKLLGIEKQLDAGQSFAVLAKKYSQDTGSASRGGNLGWLSPGDTVKPFEDALFLLKKGGVSGIVKTRFGYHLIKLDGIRKEKVESLAQKRPEIEKELRTEAASDRFYDLSEKMANKAFENPDSLGEIVESMHLKLETSPYFTRQQGKGIASNKKVRDIAFSPDVLTKGVNSDVIPLTPKDIIVLRVNDYVTARPMPLSSVSAKISAILRAKVGYKKALLAAAGVRKRIDSDAAIDMVVGKGITVDKIGPVSRQDFAKVKEPSLINATFKMSAPIGAKPVIKRVDLLSGDVALIVLNKIIEPEKIAGNRLNLIRNELHRQIASSEFSAVLREIKSKADIVINPHVLK